MSDPKSFNDLSIATRMRAWVREIVRQEIEAMRPRYRYGQVTSVNATDQTAQVVFPEGGDPMTVKYGTAVPAVNDYVRVAGLRNDRYIEDIVPLA